jgi:hypothetical protein
MKFRVYANRDASTVVAFEPWGERKTLEPGDFIEIVIPLAPDGELTFSVEYAPDAIIVHQEIMEVPQVRNSSGEEIQII